MNHSQKSYYKIETTAYLKPLKIQDHTFQEHKEKMHFHFPLRYKIMQFWGECHNVKFQVKVWKQTHKEIFVHFHHSPKQHLSVQSFPQNHKKKKNNITSDFSFSTNVKQQGITQIARQEVKQSTKQFSYLVVIFYANLLLLHEILLHLNLILSGTGTGDSDTTET